jgi:hypothetical protein
MENQKEIWIKIIELNCYYEISSLGNVKSVSRAVKSSVQKNGFRITKEKIKPSQDNGKGYKQLYVQINRKRILFYVHRLVAKYFIENPLNLPEVNHIDGNKSNNSFRNLEWVTRKENVNHAFDIGLMKNRKTGKRIKVFQISDNNVVLWNSISDASNSLKIDSSAISKVCRNINKTAGGYKWSYKNQKEARELNYLK